MLMLGIVVRMTGQSYGILANVQLFLEHVEKGDHFDGCRVSLSILNDPTSLQCSPKGGGIRISSENDD